MAFGLGFVWLPQGVLSVLLLLGELEWLSQSDEFGLGDWVPSGLLSLGCVSLFCGSVFFLLLVWETRRQWQGKVASRPGQDTL